jgi:hypothetical protein
MQQCPLARIRPHLVRVVDSRAPSGENLDDVTRLLDLATHCGFTFTPAGEDGSLWGEREGPQWRGVMVLGASGPCDAVRSRSGHRHPRTPVRPAPAPDSPPVGATGGQAPIR